MWPQKNKVNSFCLLKTKILPLKMMVDWKANLSLRWRLGSGWVLPLGNEAIFWCGTLGNLLDG